MKRNILVVGDVGAWSVLHAGDEAMLDAAVTEMSARLDVRWTVVSADPVESAARYGIPAVPHFGFPAGASDQLREARLVEILEVPLEVAASGGTSVRPSRDVRLCNRARMPR